MGSDFFKNSFYMSNYCNYYYVRKDNMFPSKLDICIKHNGQSVGSLGPNVPLINDKLMHFYKLKEFK